MQREEVVISEPCSVFIQEIRPTSTRALTWEALFKEMKRLVYIAGPLMAVTISQYSLQVISVMMVGHLDELALSSTSVAVSLSAVTGFSLLVSLSLHCQNVQFFTFSN